MWSSRLFWKLFLVYVGLNLALTIGFLVIGMSTQRREIDQQVRQRLLDSAVLLGSHVQDDMQTVLSPQTDAAERESSRSALQTLVKKLSSRTETRMTLVDAEGNVLADSDRDPRTMLNHANRAELVQAAETGEGTAIRQSPTLGIEMYYLALPVETKHGRAFVRLAVRMDTINQRLEIVRRYLWLLAIVFAAIASAVTYAVVGKIIHPLAQLTERAQAIASGKDEAPVPVVNRDEVGLLSESFNRMQSQLAKRFEQLRENNQQMSTVLGSMDEGIIAIDASENILLANDASMRLLDFSLDGHRGRPLLEVVRSRPLHEIARNCLESGSSVQTEFEASGQVRRDLAVRAALLPGEPAAGAVIVLHDISELRRLENLRQEFVANVSHELKTPLASIKAYAETLRLGALEDKDNNMRFVVQIEEQAERLHQLILDMLQIARVESGDAAFEITQVPIGQIVESCIAQHTNSAQKKQIRLEVQPPDQLLCALADEDGARAILDNLISNAIKYTPENGNVTIAWRAEDEFVCIEVQDSGIGIAPKDQSRVFERFFRVDKARSRELGGTGLGLSIVKHLSQAFGGSVVLQSKVGQGCTFRVRLPVPESV
ncbi:MAG: ATP-binding protein [Rubripirellula sp.]